MDSNGRNLVSPDGVPINPIAVGRKINLYGEAETMGFEDFATEAGFAEGDVAMNLPKVYQACLSTALRRLVLLPDEEAINIGSVERGVVFIMAKWSVASQVAFRALNKAMASLPDLDELTLYVADTDSDATEKLFSTLGDVPAGKGESYWLLEGQVQHKLSGYNDSSLPTLQDYTRQILASRKQALHQGAP